MKRSKSTRPRRSPSCSPLGGMRRSVDRARRRDPAARSSASIRSSTAVTVARARHPAREVARRRRARAQRRPAPRAGRRGAARTRGSVASARPRGSPSTVPSGVRRSGFSGRPDDLAQPQRVRGLVVVVRRRDGEADSPVRRGLPERLRVAIEGGPVDAGLDLHVRVTPSVSTRSVQRTPGRYGRWFGGPAGQDGGQRAEARILGHPVRDEPRRAAAGLGERHARVAPVGPTASASTTTISGESSRSKTSVANPAARGRTARMCGARAAPRSGARAHRDGVAIRQRGQRGPQSLVDRRVGHRRDVYTLGPRLAAPFGRRPGPGGCPYPRRVRNPTPTTPVSAMGTAPWRCESSPMNASLLHLPPRQGSARRSGPPRRDRRR